MGYNPATTKYDASRNVRIRSIEFAPNFKVSHILLSSTQVLTVGTDSVRLVEYEYERLVEGMYLQARHQDGQEARVSVQFVSLVKCTDSLLVQVQEHSNHLHHVCSVSTIPGFPAQTLS